MTIVHFGGEIVPQLFNSDGTVAVSGRVDFLVNKTASVKNVFTDSGVGTSLGDSITLDAAGRIDVWLDGVYRVRYFDINSVLIWELDDVNLDPLLAAPIGGALNLIPNGSFEIDSNADGVADEWVETQFAGGTVALETVTVQHGAQAVKFTSAGTGGGTYTVEKFITMQPGRSLVVSFALQSSAIDVRNIVDIQWFKADKTASATPSTTVYDEADNNPTSFETKVSTTVPPTDARFFKLKLTGCDSSDVTVGNTIYDDIIAFQTVAGVVGIRIFSNLGTVIKANDTSEQIIYTATIPGNLLGNHDQLVITAQGITTATATVKTIRLKHGSTLIAFNDITTSPNGERFVIRAIASRGAGTTGQAYATLQFQETPQTIGRVSLGIDFWLTEQTFSVTGQLAVAAAAEITFEGLTVDLIRGP